MNAKFILLSYLFIVFIIGVGIAGSPGFNNLGNSVKMGIAFQLGSNKSIGFIVSFNA